VSLTDSQETQMDLEERADAGSVTFAIPPRETHAVRSDQVSDSDYTPATTIDGLEQVGLLRGWWSRKDNWDASGDFVSFKARKKITDSSVLTTVVRRAVIEALVLQSSGRQDDLVGFLPVGGQPALDRVLSLGLNIESGRATITGPSGHEGLAGVEEDLRWKDEIAEGIKVDKSGNQIMPTPKPAMAQDQIASWGEEWKQISLVDAKLRFAVSTPGERHNRRHP
jgi:hypothetical protein